MQGHTNRQRQTWCQRPALLVAKPLPCACQPVPAALAALGPVPTALTDCPGAPWPPEAKDAARPRGRVAAFTLSHALGRPETQP